MKRFILFIILTVCFFIFSSVLAQGPLDRATRDQVARCTVRLDVSKAGGGAAQGSGTIVSPDGIIFTSSHVVEDANEIQVLVFDEYNTEPVLQYFAQVILISDNLDFAILQIHQDRSRRSITPSELNLPYLTSWNTSVEVGDDIVIFSYPQMGRQRLTITAGIIAAIQTQPFGVDRFDVYLSDAEFGEGGSGGVVVNSRGEFIGIPYEYVSGPDDGQLVVILPIETICEAQARACDYQPSAGVDTTPLNPDSADLIPLLDGQVLEVTQAGSNLNARSTPSTNGEVLDLLLWGDRVLWSGVRTSGGQYMWLDVLLGNGQHAYIVDNSNYVVLREINQTTPGIALGKTIRITSSGNETHLRSSASTSAREILTLYQGDLLTVIGGPQYAEYYIWWQLRSSNGLSGWAVDVPGWWQVN